MKRAAKVCFPAIVVVLFAGAVAVAPADDGRAPRQRDRGVGDPEEARGGRAGQPRVEVRPPGWIPPDGRNRGRRDWVLGVSAQPTATGVRVQSVVPGSAAAGIGLERGDVIVTVDGYQVGRVAGRLYNLGDELQSRADVRGEVVLLVQNVRNNRLMNLPVRLDRRGDRRRPPVRPPWFGPAAREGGAAAPLRQPPGDGSDESGRQPRAEQQAEQRPDNPRDRATDGESVEIE